MRNKNFVIVLLMVCWPVLSYAEVSNSYITIGVGIEDLSYIEYDDKDVILDREDGLLPGITLEVGKRWNNITSVLSGSLFNGLVDYDGQTQTRIPLKTKTDEKITRVEATIHFSLDVFEMTNVSLLAGLGHREWRRDILATRVTNSLLEFYRWKYWILGTSARLLQKGKTSVDIDVRLFRPIKPTMDVGFRNYDEVTLDLGINYGARFRILYNLVTRKGRHWILSPYWEYWNMGRSVNEGLTINGFPTTGIVWEPRSDTTVFGVSLSMRFAS